MNCFDRKPVYSLFELGAKWDLLHFHKTLGIMGYIRGFRGTLTPWQYRPLSELKTLVLPRLKALLLPRPEGQTSTKVDIGGKIGAKGTS